ncbi:MAG: response regulator [Deltaproteobacteria bacterium]|nr:response regulator [Deltaproteobacteria bacterium]
MKENISSGNKIKKTNLPRMILVVEDDEGLSRLIQKYLQREGFQTKGAINGADAISFVVNNQNIVMLLDYRLPDMSGKQVVEILAERQCRVSFIIMTGHGDVTVAVEMMKLGARDFLLKGDGFLDILPSVVKRVADQLEIEKRLHKAEGEIKETKDHLDNIIESSLDGIIVSDSMGNVIRVNKSFLVLVGFEEEEVIGKHIMELSITNMKTYESTTGEMVEINEAFLTTSMEMSVKLFEEGKVSDWESYYLRKDGIIVPVEIKLSHLYDEKGDNIGAVGVIRDITERKKVEKALQRSHDELERQVKERTAKLLQAEKLKSLGELSGGVAHDFNNVLAAILGRVQLLKKHLEPPAGKQEKRKSTLELKASLEIIERASLDGAETVRRIQEFSRRRTDDKDFTQIDINELIDNTLEFTSARWKNDAESKGIRIKIKKELSSLTPILGSPAEIREVFTNLINNTIDAMPQGGEIRIESFMDDTIAVIRISDTGKGIPKDITDKVFDPFFTTKGVQSTGLGLSVSYGIINRHRGTITVDSIEGEGTTFTIKFPITKKIRKGQVKEEKVVPIKRKPQKARILVVEDEEDVRHLLRDILIDAGHNVEVANDGHEGIEVFKKKKFDLVFTDLGMPVMSGWEVAKKIKSINREIPVVLITGWNVELDSSEMNDSGINLIIHKPFKMEQIHHLVQEGMLLRNQLKAV